MTEKIRDLPENHRRTFDLRAKVLLWINNITPQYTCVVVRDITDDTSPRPPTAWPEERIYEVRYLEGPFKGQYVPACAHDLDPYAAQKAGSTANKRSRAISAPTALMKGA